MKSGFPQVAVLAIAPAPRGFGFAAFDRHRRLVDWGAKEVRVDRNRGCIRRIEQIIRSHRPRMILIEDWRSPSCLRSQRTRALLHDIAGLAVRNGAELATCSRANMQAATRGLGGRSKYDRATALCGLFPELRATLPRRRKPWEAERHGIAVFDAVAVAVAYFGDIVAG